ncbi:asparaginase domain-containing protein [Allokutzneria sp. A3M-2-11 16]|uniref:asparaginase n=1 Tax=Allokutzneria sp. A3M-2-11 16 TaxID=2962043 RepID=UPI0020B6BFF9|nr:asparaginase domain-containing protein [Allokutzneria sp. A3M-2-11 16]MCP3804402.1 asparaginase domain-containing protein [Allokutzneria sp. A3M-2-11 16]
MKPILVLATTDTIAQSHNAVATGPKLIPSGLVPSGVVVEDVLAEPSWDVTPSTMLAIARRVRDALLVDGFGGVVVAHGFDTVEHTPFLTELMVGEVSRLGAIVFTGAVRLRDEPFSDAPRNLASSIVAAGEPALRGAGVVVCADDELHAARWVRQVDATSVRGLSSGPHPLVGKVIEGHVMLIGGAPHPVPPPVGEPETDVAVIAAYPGARAEQLSAIVDAGARGIVLDGTGIGNVPVEMFAAVGEVVDWDIPVVVASRAQPHSGTEIGIVSKVGAISSRGLGVGQARSALMVALGGGGVSYARSYFAHL